MRRGFTLIEMLILLALTALLMSILLPSLAHGRDRALGLKCQSNVRQLGMKRYSEFDSWGNSPYDFEESQNSTPDDREKLRDIKPGREGDPTRAKDGKRGDVKIGFDEFMEWNAEGEPTDFDLACPAIRHEAQNSYGIFWSAWRQPFESVRTSLPNCSIVYGCSDFRVVDVVRNFDYRHTEKASSLFADMHVESMALADFPEDLREEMSKR